MTRVKNQFFTYLISPGFRESTNLEDCCIGAEIEFMKALVSSETLDILAKSNKIDTIKDFNGGNIRDIYVVCIALGIGKKKRMMLLI